MVTRKEIIEVMMETIAEREDAINANPKAKRDRELTLVSSGFRIIETEEPQIAA